MASILRRIGLNAYLVMVPGHCFLAFTDGEGEGRGSFWFGNNSSRQRRSTTREEPPRPPDSIKKKEYSASYDTFVAALESGIEQLTEHADAFESGDDPDKQLISISEARTMGVMPLGAALDEAKRFLAPN